MKLRNGRSLKKSLALLAVSAAAGLGSVSAQAANNNCGQQFRQISLTTAHTIAGMICSLHSNNMTEKFSRIEGNSFNFVHAIQVSRNENGFQVEGTCSTALRYYSETQHQPDIFHKGFKLSLSLPDYDDTCSPTYKGTLSEIKDEREKEMNAVTKSIYDKVREMIVPENVRTVEVEFADTGYRETNSDKYIGSRSLRSIRLGHNLHSIFASGLSSAGINQGYQSEENKMAIGKGGFTQEQFFYKTGSGIFKPDFSEINAIFQMNKALDPSLANRDALRLVGNSSELYIRQNGVTNFDGDAEMNILPERDTDSNRDLMMRDQASRVLSRGASNVFYVHNYDTQSKVATVAGCSDYSYSGDYNTTAMTASDCRVKVQSLIMQLKQNQK